jgi:hypothetical protein
MKLLVIVGVLAGTATESRADVFAFKDLDGFKECLVLDHLVETVKTGTGKQTRLLGPAEIQPRCIDAAVTLLAVSKSKDLVMSFVAAVGQLSARENALGLVSLVVDQSVTACNDMAAYEVLLKALEHSADSYVTRSKAIVTRCLKDNAFRKDFVEELANSDAHIAAHACDILQDAKLVKTCKRSQP